MSVLSVIQSHCRVHALNVPSSVVSSTDTGVQQLLGILSELLDEMVNESKFNVITLETVFTVIAAEDQGALQTLAPSGYSFAYFETFFDRTLRRPLYGPLDETEWQQIKALPNPGPFYKFRIRGDHLLINPAPTAPLSKIAFEYASSWCVRSSAGVPKAAITADDDIFAFPENILKRGLAFRWKHIKGLPYQEDQTQYYNLLNNYIARDKVKRRVNVAEPQQPSIKPGVFVPSGNWMT
jgi:hypothetical protein